MTGTQVDAGRTRTYSWSDPSAWAEHLTALPGLELLRRMADGRLPAPPVAATLGFEDVEVGPGRFVVTLTPQEYHHNPIGTVHGGVLATLLDTAAACAVHTTLPAGVPFTSTDLHVRFLAPVRAGQGTVRCEGSVLSSGSRLVTAQAVITDAGGRMLAHATSTCLLLGRPPAAGLNGSERAGKG